MWKTGDIHKITRLDGQSDRITILLDGAASAILIIFALRRVVVHTTVARYFDIVFRRQ